MSETLDASSAPLIERSAEPRSAAVVLGRFFHPVMEFFVAGFLLFMFVAGFLQFNAAIRIRLFDWVVISFVTTELIVATMSVIRSRTVRLRDCLVSGKDKSGVALLRANPGYKKALSAAIGEPTLIRLSAVVFFSLLSTTQLMFVYTHAHAYGNSAVDALDRGFKNEQLPTFVHTQYQWALAWQVITGAIYLWKVLCSFYKQSSIRRLKDVDA